MQTRIYKASKTKGSLLSGISVVKEKYTDHQSIVFLKKQHLNVYTNVPLTGETRSYLEVYVTRQEDCNDTVNNGLMFPDAKVKIFPCSSLDNSAKTVNLKLRIERNLVVFGTILDLGIVTDPAAGFFMDSGYAVLNIYQNENTSDVNKFQELSHQISWCDADDVFPITWNNMPTLCRYYHKEDRTNSNVPDLKLKLSVTVVISMVTRSFECPCRNFPLSPHKKRDRKPYQL
ncbi:unnamed protein product [Rhizopus microsporus]|nr:hypothetical protein RMCBS344292_14578 [Rhizopus microsporus]